MSREKIILSWSGGKDSALALHALQQGAEYEVVALLTSIAERYDRISHHGVRTELLERQAEAVGIPLDKVYLPSSNDLPCNNNVYEQIMQQALLPHQANGIATVAHGDIFLEDLRDYRERNLAKIGMHGLFPLWKQDTAELLQAFVALGFRAYLSCVEAVLGPDFAGRAIDAAFPGDLPEGVDPCGENGEYHSFVYDGPIFQKPVDVRVGEVVTRDGRYYADLLPAETACETASRPVAMPPVR